MIFPRQNTHTNPAIYEQFRVQFSEILNNSTVEVFRLKY